VIPDTGLNEKSYVTGSANAGILSVIVKTTVKAPIREWTVIDFQAGGISSLTPFLVDGVKRWVIHGIRAIELKKVERNEWYC
jgi:hypothetical protein